MNKYEAMFIIKPDLSEEERKTLFSQISDAVIKHNGTVEQAAVWGERRKLFFPLKKQHEGLYYLMNFTSPPLAVKDIRHAYRLNEFILRVLITNQQ
ncbi:MAG: 30S ribosomal protein S6 [Candidatus Omnitrophica bacterium]|nr:30S ribosomal protein S6 [Candidatus Omnitrophota bacterium]